MHELFINQPCLQSVQSCPIFKSSTELLWHNINKENSSFRSVRHYSVHTMRLSKQRTRSTAVRAPRLCAARKAVKKHLSGHGVAR